MESVRLMFRSFVSKRLKISLAEYDFAEKVRVEVDQDVDFILILLAYVVIFVFFAFFRLSNITVDPMWFARSGALLVIFAVVVNIYSGVRKRKKNEAKLASADVPLVMVHRYAPIYKSKYGYLSEQDSADILLEKYLKKAVMKRSVNHDKLILTEMLLAILGTFIWAFGDILVKFMVGNLPLIICCDILIILIFSKILFYDVDVKVRTIFNKFYN